MHLSHCIDIACGSAHLESSAKYQLLEFDMDINGTPSIALINSDAFHCFAYKYLVKIAHLTTL